MLTLCNRIMLMLCDVITLTHFIPHTDPCVHIHCFPDTDACVCDLCFPNTDLSVSGT